VAFYLPQAIGQALLLNYGYNSNQLQETNPKQKYLWVHLIASSKWLHSLKWELILSFFLMYSGMNTREENTTLSSSYRTWYQIFFDSPPTPTSLTWQVDRIPKLYNNWDLVTSVYKLWFTWNWTKSNLISRCFSGMEKLTLLVWSHTFLTCVPIGVTEYTGYVKLLCICVPLPQLPKRAGGKDTTQFGLSKK